MRYAPRLSPALNRMVFSASTLRAAHVNTVAFTIGVFPEVVAPLVFWHGARATNPPCARIVRVWRCSVVREHTNAVTVIAVFAALRKRGLYVNGAHMHGAEPLMAFVALVVLRKLLHHLSHKSGLTGRSSGQATHLCVRALPYAIRRHAQLPRRTAA